MYNISMQNPTVFCFWCSILNSKVFCVCGIYMVLNQALYLFKVYFLKPVVTRMNLLLKISKWNDACNRRSKGWGIQT